jgi:WD40 repeat protein
MQEKNLYDTQKFTMVNPSTTIATDAICSNGVQTAVAWKDPASIVVVPNDCNKKFEASQQMLKGHKDVITDMGWSPYQPALLASSSKDTTVKLWMMEDINFGVENMTK